MRDEHRTADDGSPGPGEVLRDLPPGLEAVLRRLHRDGEAEHGALALSYERFAGRVVARVCRRLGDPRPSPGRIGEALEKLAGADLYLAIACDERVPGSWERFSERFVPRLWKLARSRGAPEEEAEELVRDLTGDLLAPPHSGGARTRLGTFGGSGCLFAWLSVILIRAQADRARSRRPASLEPEEEQALAAGPATDPIVAAGDTEDARRISVALDSGWERLTDREALAVLYVYHDGLSQKEAARALGIGAPRVCRLLEAALGKLRQAIQPMAGSLPGPGPGRDRVLKALLGLAERDRGSTRHAETRT